MASFLSEAYVDQSKVKGLEDNPLTPEVIWTQYVEAFKKGAFNFIREEPDPFTDELIPRKYFSGGMNFAQGLNTAMVVQTRAPAGFISGDRAMVVKSRIAPHDAVSRSHDIRAEGRIERELKQKVFDALGARFRSFSRKKRDPLRMLDLSAGNGELTGEVSQYFDEVVAVENNAEKLQNLRLLTSSRHHDNFTIQEKTSEEAVNYLGGQKFDVILLSQNLYLDRERENDFIRDQVLPLLRKGGMFVVIRYSNQNIPGTNGHARNWLRAKPSLTAREDVRSLEERLRDWSEVERETVGIVHTTKDREEMISVVGNVIPPGSRDEREIGRYVDDFLKTPKGYTFKVSQDILWVEPQRGTQMRTQRPGAFPEVPMPGKREGEALQRQLQAEEDRAVTEVLNNGFEWNLYRRPGIPRRLLVVGAGAGEQTAAWLQHFDEAVALERPRDSRTLRDLRDTAARVGFRVRTGEYDEVLAQLPSGPREQFDAVVISIHAWSSILLRDREDFLKTRVLPFLAPGGSLVILTNSYDSSLKGSVAELRQIVQPELQRGRVEGHEALIAGLREGGLTVDDQEFEAPVSRDTFQEMVQAAGMLVSKEYRENAWPRIVRYVAENLDDRGGYRFILNGTTLWIKRSNVPEEDIAENDETQSLALAGTLEDREPMPAEVEPELEEALAGPEEITAVSREAVVVRSDGEENFDTVLERVAAIPFVPKSQEVRESLAGVLLALRVRGLSVFDEESARKMVDKARGKLHAKLVFLKELLGVLDNEGRPLFLFPDAVRIARDKAVERAEEILFNITTLMKIGLEEGQQFFDGNQVQYIIFAPGDLAGHVDFIDELRGERIFTAADITRIIRAAGTHEEKKQLVERWRAVRGPDGKEPLLTGGEIAKFIDQRLDLSGKEPDLQKALARAGERFHREARGSSGWLIETESMAEMEAWGGRTAGHFMEHLDRTDPPLRKEELLKLRWRGHAVFSDKQAEAILAKRSSGGRGMADRVGLLHDALAAAFRAGRDPADIQGITQIAVDYFLKRHAAVREELLWLLGMRSPAEGSLLFTTYDIGLIVRTAAPLGEKRTEMSYFLSVPAREGEGLFFNHVQIALMMTNRGGLGQKKELIDDLIGLTWFDGSYLFSSANISRIVQSTMPHEEKTALLGDLRGRKVAVGGREVAFLSGGQITDIVFQRKLRSRQEEVIASYRLGFLDAQAAAATRTGGGASSAGVPLRDAPAPTAESAIEDHGFNRFLDEFEAHARTPQATRHQLERVTLAGKKLFSVDVLEAVGSSVRRGMSDLKKRLEFIRYLVEEAERQKRPVREPRDLDVLSGLFLQYPLARDQEMREQAAWFLGFRSSDEEEVFFPLKTIALMLPQAESLSHKEEIIRLLMAQRTDDGKRLFTIGQIAAIVGQSLAYPEKMALLRNLLPLAAGSGGRLLSGADITYVVNLYADKHVRNFLEIWAAPQGDEDLRRRSLQDMQWFFSRGLVLRQYLRLMGLPMSMAERRALFDQLGEFTVRETRRGLLQTSEVISIMGSPLPPGEDPVEYRLRWVAHLQGLRLPEGNGTQYLTGNEIVRLMAAGFGARTPEEQRRMIDEIARSPRTFTRVQQEADIMDDGKFEALWESLNLGTWSHHMSVWHKLRALTLAGRAVFTPDQLRALSSPQGPGKERVLRRLLFLRDVVREALAQGRGNEAALEFVPLALAYDLDREADVRRDVFWLLDPVLSGFRFSAASIIRISMNARLSSEDRRREIAYYGSVLTPEGKILFSEGDAVRMLAGSRMPLEEKTALIQRLTGDTARSRGLHFQGHQVAAILTRISSHNRSVLTRKTALLNNVLAWQDSQGISILDEEEISLVIKRYKYIDGERLASIWERFQGTAVSFHTLVRYMAFREETRGLFQRWVLGHPGDISEEDWRARFFLLSRPQLQSDTTLRPVDEEDVAWLAGELFPDEPAWGERIRATAREDEQLARRLDAKHRADPRVIRQLKGSFSTDARRMVTGMIFPWLNLPEGPGAEGGSLLNRALKQAEEGGRGAGMSGSRASEGDFMDTFYRAVESYGWYRDNASWKRFTGNIILQISRFSRQITIMAQASPGEKSLLLMKRELEKTPRASLMLDLRLAGFIEGRRELLKILQEEGYLDEDYVYVPGSAGMSQSRLRFLYSPQEIESIRRVIEKPRRPLTRQEVFESLIKKFPEDLVREKMGGEFERGRTDITDAETESGERPRELGRAIGQSGGLALPAVRVDVPGFSPISLRAGTVGQAIGQFMQYYADEDPDEIMREIAAGGFTVVITEGSRRREVRGEDLGDFFDFSLSEETNIVVQPGEDLAGEGTGEPFGGAVRVVINGQSYDVEGVGTMAEALRRLGERDPAVDRVRRMMEYRPQDFRLRHENPDPEGEAEDESVDLSRSVDDGEVLYVDEVSLERDAAMSRQAPGGIDLNPAGLDLLSRGDGKGIRFDIDPDLREEYRSAEGLVPVIIKVDPLNDVPGFLGVRQ
jgi:hypothetical protein